MRKFFFTVFVAASVLAGTAGAAIAEGALPACEMEDSDNCYWDASERGNGQGKDFKTLDGVTYYADGTVLAPEVEAAEVAVSADAPASFERAGVAGVVRSAVEAPVVAVEPVEALVAPVAAPVAPVAVAAPVAAPVAPVEPVRAPVNVPSLAEVPANESGVPVTQSGDIVGGFEVGHRAG